MWSQNPLGILVIRHSRETVIMNDDVVTLRPRCIFKQGNSNIAATSALMMHFPFYDSLQPLPDTCRQDTLVEIVIVIGSTGHKESTNGRQSVFFLVRLLRQPTFAPYLVQAEADYEKTIEWFFRTARHVLLKREIPRPARKEWTSESQNTADFAGAKS